MDVHPNFKKGYENMKEVMKTKRAKKIYGQAVAKDHAKYKALKAKMGEKK